jgi:hypothetical protein
LISKEEYEKNKAYWDYQRLKAYNRELVRMEAEEFVKESDMDIDILFETMWNTIEDGDYQTPVAEWEPKDPKYQISKI